MADLFDIIVSHGLLFWLGLAGVLLAIELLTGTAWFLWAAASAALIAGLGLFPMFADPRMQILAFVAVAVVTTFAGRPYVKKLRASGPDINSRDLVGRMAEVVEDFDGPHGRVFIDGAEWAAQCDEATPLRTGMQVVVTQRVEGALLLVRAA